MTDLETVERLYRQERNKAAVDKACKWFAIAMVGCFWLLVVSLCVIEAFREIPVSHSV